MRTTKLAFVSVAAMALSAGAAYSITPDGGFQRTARADTALVPLEMLEPDADWFRPRVDVVELTGAATAPAPGPEATAAPRPEPVPVSVALAPAKPPVHRNPRPAWGQKMAFPQQAVFAPPTSSARPAATSFSSVKK